jgi:hypothetical protein
MSIQRNSFFISGEWVVPSTSDVDSWRPADRGAGACLVSHPGTAFPGGADIKQFGTPKTKAKPKLKPVHCYELPGIHAINFVCRRAPGGGMISLPLGKGMAQMRPGMPAEVPESPLQERPA